MGRGALGYDWDSRGTLREVQDGSGTLGEVRDRSGDLRGGLLHVVGPSGRSGRGRGMHLEVLDGSEVTRGCPGRVRGP